ncbi:Uncharacterised protein [Orientia tsutsugamushi]|nr:Uncharacterised protein [Orientia tsutsugamushi]
MKLLRKRNTENPYVKFDVVSDGNGDNYTTVPSLDPAFGRKSTSTLTYPLKA